MFATLISPGVCSASTQTECGRSVRAIRRATICVLLAVLRALHQLLAEVVVDRRVGAAAGRAGERDAGGAGAAAADQELRAGAEERRLGRADAEAEAGREELAHRSERRRRVVRGGRLDRDLAGEDDLRELPGADPLDRGADRARVVARRGDRRDRRVPARVRVEDRKRAVDERGDPPAQARGDVLGAPLPRRSPPRPSARCARRRGTATAPAGRAAPAEATTTATPGRRRRRTRTRRSRPGRRRPGARSARRRSGRG